MHCGTSNGSHFSSSELSIPTQSISPLLCTEYVGLRCVQDIFTGLCELLESMYTLNLESLTKLQECIKLLEQGESLLAAADSITAKFTRGLETKGMTVLPEMTEDIR